MDNILIDNKMDWNSFLSKYFLIQIFALLLVLTPIVLNFNPLLVISVLLILIGMAYEGFDRIGFLNKNLYLITGAIILVLMSVVIYLIIIKGFYNLSTVYLMSIGIFELTYCLVVHKTFQIDKFNPIIQNYRRIFENNPKDASCWHNFGVDLALAGRYYMAIRCFDKVLELDPQDYLALYNKSVVLRRILNQEFRKYREKALDIDPNLDNAKKSGKTILKFSWWRKGIDIEK